MKMRRKNLRGCWAKEEHRGADSGMVYTEQGDAENARTMYQQYINEAENGAKGYNGLALCDIAEEIMILLFPIFPAAFQALPQRKCRACFLMRL